MENPFADIAQWERYWDMSDLERIREDEREKERQKAIEQKWADRFKHGIQLECEQY